LARTIKPQAPPAICKTRKDEVVSSQLLSLPELSQALQRDERLLGLDVGTKTIGLALSDVTRRIATPLETIRRTKFSADAARLLAIASEQEVGGLVIGLPVNLDGSEGPRAQSTRAFVRNLAPLTDLPMAFWDERLSTAAAERALIEADASRKRRAELIDKMAAAYILQGALDRLNFGTG
jgi:putative Holliday junction resolvase